MNLEYNIVKMEEQIEKLKCEIASMKVKLKEQDKLKLKGGSGYCLKTLYTAYNTSTFANDGSVVTRGAFRATKELAEIADSNMVTRNRLEAYVHQIQGDGEGKYTIALDGNYTYDIRAYITLGAVYMQKETAEILSKALNASEIEL